MPGLGITGIAALAASWLSEHYGAPLMLMGLLIGLALNFINADARLHPGLGLASKALLRWGIVVTGLQITVWQIVDLGGASFLWIAGSVALVTLTGMLTARWLGYSSAVGVLAGGAVAICGASAALALATVLGAKRINQAQLTLVLVAVAAASALAMSLYPLIAQALGLSGKQAGYLVGASIHDVAQALGAGYSFSNEAGETAAIVKLTRVALLVPALAVFAVIFASPTGQARGRLEAPWFILGFLALAALNSFAHFPVEVNRIAKSVTSALLLLAVTATGIRSPMQWLLGQGWRGAMPVIVATVLSFALGLGGALVLGCRSKGSRVVHHFKIASGEVATIAGKTRAKGCLRLGAPISFARLACVPIKCASGASGNRRKRKPPKGISDAESAFEVGGAD